FKKPASPTLTTVSVSTEEPTGKLKRVKRPAKKSTQAPARGVIIRETPKIPVSKKKEKVDVAKGKGIELLSDVALTEEAYTAIIKPSVTNEGTGVKPGVPDVTEKESFENNENEPDSEHEINESGFESDQEKDEEKIEDDEEEENEEIVKTLSNDSDDEDGTKVANKAEADKDEEKDSTTSLLYDDIDIRLNEPVDTDKGFVQEESTNAAMTNIQ
nr:hypothetical protein [Tanacetum cinerariifolium]